MAKAKRYLNQMEAGRFYGCSRPAIAQAMNPGKSLYPAVVLRNGMRLIDMKKPAAIAHRAGLRPVELALPKVETGKKSKGGSNTVSVEEPAEAEAVIRKYWDYTLGQIFTRHGSLTAFKVLLDSLDKIESIHARRLVADRSTGELISREYVRRHVLGLVEKTNQRMLSEMPTKLSYEIHGKCSTGASVEEIQTAIKAALSRELRGIKSDVQKAIKNATD